MLKKKQEKTLQNKSQRLLERRTAIVREAIVSILCLYQKNHQTEYYRYNRTKLVVFNNS